MNFEEIRSRLAGLGGRSYWRSLDEAADSQEFREYVNREFPAQASEFTDPAGRRQFLKLMGASLALAGVGACTRQPDEMIVPYVTQPEEVVPGRPLFFATSMPQGGFAMPLLAENHMGRPTKMEGNREHPASLGATDIFGQASVLALYDPDRSRSIINRGNPQTWDAFVAALQTATSFQQTVQGAGLRLLTGPISSPSLVDQIDTLLASMPNARWHQWDPVFGTVQGGAPAEAALYRFDRADVVVSLDADFLGFGAGSLRYQKDFASRRRITSPTDEQNRLYMVEPVPSLTGTKADHKLAVKARDIAAVAQALSAALGVAGATAPAATPVPASWIEAAASDLKAHPGRALVVAGDRQPAAVHALARAMNEALGGVGATVIYTPPVTASPANGTESLASLVSDMNAGSVQFLLIIGTNPVFTAPADLGFAEAMTKVGTCAHLGLYYDETAEKCQWHVPEAHYLESWGDGRSFDGTLTMIQPLIAPLYSGRQAIEVFATLNGAAGSPSDLVKAYWTKAFGGGTKVSWTLRDQKGQPFPDFDTFWRHALYYGFVSGTSLLEGAPATPARGTAAPMAAAAPTSSGTAGSSAATGPLEIVLRPDPTILDGRYANSGWLQELPKPLSKMTWDAVAYIGVRLAEQRGLSNEDLIEIRSGGRSVRLPVWILPGTADDVVAVHFGYGSEKAGRVGSKVGFNAYGIRSSSAPWFTQGDVVKTGETYTLAATQNHFVMEGRNPVRVVDAAAYRANPGKAVAESGAESPARLADAVPGLRVQELQVGHVDRPQRLHGLRGVHRGVRRREQHRGGRQGRGEADARDALDPRRHLFRGRPGHAAHLPPAGAVPAVRGRAVRAGLPGGRHAAQR